MSYRVSTEVSPIRREKAAFQEKDELELKCQRAYSMQRPKTSETSEYNHLKGLYGKNPLNEAQRKS